MTLPEDFTDRLMQRIGQKEEKPTHHRTWLYAAIGAIAAGILLLLSAALLKPDRQVRVFCISAAVLLLYFARTSCLCRIPLPPEGSYQVEALVTSIPAVRPEDRHVTVHLSDVRLVGEDSGTSSLTAPRILRSREAFGEEQ